MKNITSETKWLAKQTRPFIRSILFIVFFEGITVLSSVSIAVLSKTLIDSAIKGLFEKAIIASVIFACLILLQVGCKALSSIISARTNGLLVNSLQQKIYISLSQSKWSDYSKYHSEDLMTRLTNDAQLISDSIVSIVPNMIALGIRLISAFVVLFIFDPTLALIAFCLGPFTLLFNRYFGRKLRKIHIKTQESESLFRESLHESIQNMLVIKSFNLEESSSSHVGDLQENRLSWIVQKSRLTVVASSILSLGYWFGYFLAFCWGAFGLYKGSVSFGTMTVFLQLVGQVQGPFIGLSQSYPHVISTLASTGRILELQNIPLEEIDEAAPSMKEVGIELNQVYFSYSEDTPILENISLTIQPGETVALIGPSGIGKTTFIQLLLALLYPTSGHIYFFDKEGNKRKANSSTLPLISYVPQGNTLFSGTIGENILVGNPTASSDEIETAAKLSNAWEFIKKLPESLETRIGEKGFGLSEGQDQRIAIVRAILRKSPVLILDEATSALDLDSEKKILEAIKDLKPARTCIIITHRNTALPICSRVFKIEDNHILNMRTV